MIGQDTEELRERRKQLVIEMQKVLPNFILTDALIPDSTKQALIQALELGDIPKFNGILRGSERTRNWDIIDCTGAYWDSLEDAWPYTRTRHLERYLDDCEMYLNRLREIQK